MCGRFTQSKSLAEYQDRFSFSAGPLEYAPRFNLAPGREALAVLAGEDGRRGEMLRWGLVPSWAKDERVGYKMINARAETVADKPAYRGPFRRARCLIPAEGFFEWAPAAGGKQPFFLARKDREPFALAGLWDQWSGPEGGTLRSFTIITTQANQVVKPIHDRMPVMLSTGDEAAWLDPAASPEDLATLLRPYAAQEMQAQPVSRRVNSAAGEGPKLIEPVALPGDLFG
ncbi:MAG: SOS response-associated peptidase [Desulfarculus sp.]|nr:SOS response-associated peptidase [Pseudomonadota bacterium]MBV1715714.1 SOS response-associated peptidase [Desulfarculus sp.]MBU4575729.1 SOS response-associated peptidase [Pseudomonadota bacterium]MBU4597251.1 SOS response-associated peptidase [Pseudomonadota bacterium]MBV1739047.1 SOS response-associated peptidase [Desulfarculus sp.]